MKRKNKYSRRSTLNTKKKKVLPVILVSVLSFAVLLALAVGLGAYLRYKADSYTPKKNYGELGNTPPKSDGAEAVYAPIFNYGDYLFGLIKKDYTDFSVLLGGGGRVSFESEVAKTDPSVKVAENDLAEYARVIHENGGKLCGYFYSSAFDIQDENLRRVKKAFEVSIICEAVQLGVDDVLILGINADKYNCDEVASYLSEINANADASVGIAVNVGAVLNTENGDYTVGKLKNSCDFAALDLRNLSFAEVSENSNAPKNLGEYLSGIKYYLSSYSLRLVFSEDNGEFFDEAKELGFENVQAVNNIKQEINTEDTENKEKPKG